MGKRFFILPVSILLFILASCDNSMVKENWKSMPPSGWHRDSTLSFSFMVTDTMQYYNLLIGVRNQATYPYRNMWMFVKTTGPDLKFRIDTVEIFLATADGQWYGKGWGDIFTASLPFREMVRFSKVGKYTLSLKQGMRTTTLKGISDIGMRIEKSEN